jgi:hypothetical protein
MKKNQPIPQREYAQLKKLSHSSQAKLVGFEAHAQIMLVEEKAKAHP